MGFVTNPVPNKCSEVESGLGLTPTASLSQNPPKVFSGADFVLSLRYTIYSRIIRYMQYTYVTYINIYICIYIYI